MSPSDEPGAAPPAADSPIEPTPTPARWGRRVAIGLGVALVLYAALGFLVVPRIVSSQLKQVVAETLGVEPTIASVSFDPFDVRLELESVALDDPSIGGEAVAFDALVVDLAFLRLFVGRIAFEEVALLGPRVSAILDEAGRLNLLALVPDAPDDPPEETEEADAGSPLEITVDALRLADGAIRLVDERRTPAYATALGPIDLSIEDFTTRAGVESPGELSFVFGDAGELRWDGRFSLAPLQSSGELTLATFDLRLPAEALAPQLRFAVAGGTIDASLRYVLGSEEGLSLDVEAGTVSLADLSLRDPADDLEALALPRVEIEGVAVRVEDARLAALEVGGVRVDGGALRTRLEANGALHVAELMRPVGEGAVSSTGDAETAPEASDPGAPAPAPAPAPVATEQLAEAAEDATRADPPAVEARAPAIHVDRVALAGFAVHFEDHRLSPPGKLSLASVDATVTDYDSEPGQPLGLDVTVRSGAGGTLAIEGPVTPEPLSAELAVRAEALVLGPIEPWVQPVARVRIPSGRLEADLRVGFSTGASDAVAVSGRVELAELSVVDRVDDAPFVDARSLRIEGLDFSPDRVVIEEIGVAGLKAQAGIRADGTTTLASIFPGGGAEDASARGGTKTSGRNAEATAKDPSSGPGPRIEIARIRLEGVGGAFADRSFDPPFTIGLEDLGGRIDGLTSDTGSRAEVALEGRVDGVAPLRIAGRVDPLASDAFTDLAIDLQGLPVPTFGPYARRYLGYAIERGNLGLDLDYRIEARHLEASNRVLLDGLDFGPRVESDQATNLPVRLAIAVLRDAQGHIEIPLPIEGDLDDPSFSVVALLRNTAINVVSRVATAPFAAIASVAGLVGASGDDLSRVAFEAGSTRLDEQERRELDGLAGVLAERPTLRLEIRGRADPSAEASELRRVRLREAIRRRADPSRASEGEGASEAAPPLDPAVELEGLSRLYAERLGGDLRDRVPPASLPSQEPERTKALIEAGLAALEATVELDPSDWQALARGRAAAIQGALIATQRVGAERLYLVDVEVGPVGDGGRIPSELALTTD